MRHFRHHANALAQRRVPVNRLADADGNCALLDGRSDVADLLTGVGANHTVARDFAVPLNSYFSSAFKLTFGIIN